MSRLCHLGWEGLGQKDGKVTSWDHFGHDGWVSKHHHLVLMEVVEVLGHGEWCNLGDPLGVGDAHQKCCLVAQEPYWACGQRLRRGGVGEDLED